MEIGLPSHGLTCVVCSPLNFQKGGSDGHLATRRLPKLTQLRLCLWQKGTWSRRATSKRVGRAVQLPAPASLTFRGEQKSGATRSAPGRTGAPIGFSSIAPRVGLVGLRQHLFVAAIVARLRAALAKATSFKSLVKTATLTPQRGLAGWRRTKLRHADARFAFFRLSLIWLQDRRAGLRSGRVRRPRLAASSPE